MFQRNKDTVKNSIDRVVNKYCRDVTDDERVQKKRKKEVGESSGSGNSNEAKNSCPRSESVVVQTPVDTPMGASPDDPRLNTRRESPVVTENVQRESGQVVQSPKPELSELDESIKSIIRSVESNLQTTTVPPTGHQQRPNYAEPFTMDYSSSPERSDDQLSSDGLSSDPEYLCNRTNN